MKKILLATIIFFLFGFSGSEYHYFEQDGFRFLDTEEIDDKCETFEYSAEPIREKCEELDLDFLTYIHTDIDNQQILEGLTNDMGEKLVEIVKNNHNINDKVMLSISKPGACQPIFYYVDGLTFIDFEICRNSKHKMIYNVDLDFDSISRLPIFRNNYIAHNSNNGFLHLKTREPVKNQILSGVWERVDIFIVESGDNVVVMVSGTYYKGFKPGNVFRSTYDRYPNELEAFTIELVSRLKTQIAQK